MQTNVKMLVTSVPVLLACCKGQLNKVKGVIGLHGPTPINYQQHLRVCYVITQVVEIIP